MRAEVKFEEVMDLLHELRWTIGQFLEHCFQEKDQNGRTITRQACYRQRVSSFLGKIHDLWFRHPGLERLRCIKLRLWHRSQVSSRRELVVVRWRLQSLLLALPLALRWMFLLPLQLLSATSPRPQKPLLPSQPSDTGKRSGRNN